MFATKHTVEMLEATYPLTEEDDILGANIRYVYRTKFHIWVFLQRPRRRRIFFEFL
jgi:hypothetical protein